MCVLMFVLGLVAEDFCTHDGCETLDGSVDPAHTAATTQRAGMHGSPQEVYVISHTNWAFLEYAYSISSHLNSNPPFFLCLTTSFVFTNYQPIQRNASYNRTIHIMHKYCIMQQGFMSQIQYINILVNWSLSGMLTSKLVIRESESPRPAALSILILRMTSSSVIIPYINKTSTDRELAVSKRSDSKIRTVVLHGGHSNRPHI